MNPPDYGLTCLVFSFVMDIDNRGTILRLVVDMVSIRLSRQALSESTLSSGLSRSHSYTVSYAASMKLELHFLRGCVFG
jgi:hypothetical protein